MVRYTLDSALSRFTVQAFKAGMLSALGHSPTFAIREYAGDLRMTPEAGTGATLHLHVKADSLIVTDSVSPKDREDIEGRMRREVLETASYPEIIYQADDAVADKVADNWYILRLKGQLQLHGVKKSVEVDAQLRIAEDQARLSGQCKLLLSAFRIKPVTALGGLIKLKDELKFDFDLVGRKSNE
jgi:polyisoprenoid-binding protein YceI